jgi:hypothetical protein
MTIALKTKPGINGANVLSIPETWNPNWFRHFINNSLKGADVRNAEGTGGITITGNISSPYATIGFSGSSSGISTVTSTGATITVTDPTGPTVNLDLPASGVVAGSYTSANITVNAEGVVTAAANGSGGGGSQLPGTIPDLVMWVETDNILGAAGSVVGRIQEKTPWITGVAATAPALSASPIIAAVISPTQVNSLNVLKWPATTAGNYAISPGLTLNLGATYFVVVLPLANSTGSQALVAGTASGGTALYLTNASGNNALAIVDEGTAGIGTSSALWTVGVPFQANVTYNPTTGAFAFRQSRAVANSGTGPTGVGTTNGLLNVLGGDQFGSNLNAAIAAVIVYNRVLTSTEITNVENYLNTKWGV